MNESQVDALVRKVVNDTISSPAIQALVEKTSTLSAEKAITNSFVAMGIDAKNPLEVQADMQFVRGVRLTIKTGARKGVIAGIGMVLVAIVGGISFLLTEWLRSKGI